MTATRARDTDRTATCALLDTAFAEGQIDGSEHRQRTAAAMRARSVAELSALVADLQRGRRADPPPGSGDQNALPHPLSVRPPAPDRADPS